MKTKQNENKIVNHSKCNSPLHPGRCLGKLNSLFKFQHVLKVVLLLLVQHWHSRTEAKHGTNKITMSGEDRKAPYEALTTILISTIG